MYEHADSRLMEVGMVMQTTAFAFPRSVEREVAFTTVAVVVGLEVGSQTIGPTRIILSCDVIVISVIPFGLWCPKRCRQKLLVRAKWAMLLLTLGVENLRRTLL